MTVGFLQKYSDIKTPAPGLNFEPCSARLFNKVKAFWKIYLWQSVLILWQAPQINQCMGNTVVS